MKNKLKLLCVLSFWIILVVMNVVSVDVESSSTERRKLAQSPTITMDSILSTKYMTDFETYVLDQFYQRDVFRGIKANLDLVVLNKLDYHDLYLNGDSLVKIEYPLNEYSIEHSIKLFNNIKEFYLDDQDVFLSIIPDKHYFNEDVRYPMLDYTYMVDYIVEQTGFNYIDIMDCLSLEDYYYSDPHWNQIYLESVVNVLLEGMHQDGILLNQYGVALEDYKGLYQGQLGLQTIKEDLAYVSDDLFMSLQVKDLTTGDVFEVYNDDKLFGYDPYDFFLAGAMPLLEIENSNAMTDDEIIIFRDSYGSSIAPLLLSTYQKVTLVDIRYISHQYLEDYIDFDDQSILFLYSTTVLNNSSTLR